MLLFLGVRPSTTVHNSSFHAVPTTSSSTPLNLVMQQHQAAQQHPEQQKKETELWMPWQQPVNHHPKENNSQDAGNSMKHPAFRPMVQIKLFKKQYLTNELKAETF